MSNILEFTAKESLKEYENWLEWMKQIWIGTMSEEYLQKEQN